MVRNTLESVGLKVELTNYMRLDLIRFLLPVEYFRGKVIDEIWTQIEFARQRHPKAVFSIIAHSFGTYVVAEILRQKFTMQAERVIFCGSVVRYDFPFQQISSRFKGEIINEIGTADPWPAIAESLTTGFGSAGTYGFRRPGVRDRWHNGFRHSDFLKPDFCRKFWIPYLLIPGDQSIVEGDTEPEPPPWWVSLIWILKIKYLLSVVATFLIVIWVLRAIYGSTVGYYLGADEAKTFPWNDQIIQIVRDAGVVCPFPRWVCSRPKLTWLLAQRRFATIEYFDEKLKPVVSCSNFRWGGTDPTAALEAFAAKFPQCVQLDFREDGRLYSVRVRPEGLVLNAATGAPSCGCPKP
ncbi:hypothetical protein XF30_20105 [Bradyrhizobium sp. SUTN9-2]|nr:hypothetical protein XF30_20105 [Bradyrhizobium sp. SUTN9-2]